MNSRRSILVLLAVAAFAACRSEAPVAGRPPSSAAADTVRTVNAIAERYVRLVLALGQHDADYVDAYYGPPEWKTEALARRRSLPEIRSEANRLIARIETLPPPPASEKDELPRLRRRYLSQQLRSLAARADIRSGRTMSFDDESRALYDVAAPVESEDRLREVVEEIGRLLPGEAPLIERYEAFRREFIVPREKLDKVFTAAIEAARARTKAHIPLPPGESFTVEYVKDKPWGAYNWYQGNFKSLIQVNTELPTYVDQALDLASHEGYPGHHVYNVLLEKSLVRDRGWIEFTVYPLYSPQSLIAEGSANFGIDVAFPGAERTAFEREVLFPAAGLDPSKVEKYERVRVLTEKLSYAANEAARRYVNREMDAKATVAWLGEFALLPRARAEHRMKFIQKYRSYVINYNLGKDMVRRYIEARGGTADRPGRRWEEFGKLLSSPRLPSDITVR